MAKYEAGNKFVVNITEVDDSGMGTLYWLNGVMMCNDKQLDKFIPLSDEELPMAAPKKAHTLDDLRNRIFLLSKTLAEVIEEYEKAKSRVDIACEIADSVIEE